MKWKEVQIRAQSLILWKLLCRKSAFVFAHYIPVLRLPEFNSSSYFGDGLLSSSSKKRCSHFKSAFYLFCPHKFKASHLQIFVQRKGERFVLKTTLIAATCTFCYSVQTSFAKVYLLSVLRTLNGGWKRKLKSQVMDPAVSSILGFMV